MKKEDVITYFGNQEKTAQALGITQASVSKWGEDVPPLRAFEIERLTAGRLKVNFTKPQAHKGPNGRLAIRQPAGETPLFLLSKSEREAKALEACRNTLLSEE